MRPISCSSCATNSGIRAAVGHSASEGNSSISVRTLRSVSYTDYIRSRLFKKSPQLELFLMAVFT